MNRMKWILGVPILMVLCACGHQAPRGQVQRLPIDPLYQSEGITHTFIFRSAHQLTFEGEGFFLALPGGQEVFVLSSPEDNPHEIANLKRSLQAVRKVGATVVPPRTESEEVYLSTKYDLGAEHRVLSPTEIHALAEEVVRRGNRRAVAWVNHRHLQVPSVTLNFSCGGMEGMDPITMTTGGSVYVLTIHFKDGEALSLVEAASLPNAQDKLIAKKALLEEAARTSKMIRAENLQYHREFFTTEGPRSGWSTFVDKVSVEGCP
ncbi:MAG: hypothetical protein A2Z40_01680 [Deltaproteobacteria bacterium RBG_19FT_COMBO_60_16]|nr:MAG: hypothetical protein A2Z13_04070 [Deltaproteobacteria bacterium RBG_16_64_85]OGQ01240.1 MAG: hypothetical protein A2Z40_01680 [Deltaproteobacteria bacterium RBG_19FT_COMBO_60_16]